MDPKLEEAVYTGLVLTLILMLMILAIVKA